MRLYLADLADRRFDRPSCQRRRRTQPADKQVEQAVGSSGCDQMPQMPHIAMPDGLGPVYYRLQSGLTEHRGYVVDNQGMAPRGFSDPIRHGHRHNS